MESIGGFELVRRLGSGPRAEVFLGSSRATHPPERDGAAAIKVYRSSTPTADIEREIEALTRVESEHLVRVLDIATAPDGKPALVLGPIGTRKLSELIVASRTLTAGEVVTATVPIVGAVADLHRAGVSHGAVRLNSISFDRRGAPILMGFGRARLLWHPPAGIDPPRRLSPAIVEHAIAADLADLAVLIRSVCDASDVDARRLFDYLDRLPAAGAHAAWCDRLADVMHDLGQGEPVRFDGHAAQVPRTAALVPRGAQSDPSAQGERRTAIIERRAGTTPAWIAALALPDAIVEVIRSPMPEMARRLARALRLVRRPFWIAGGGVAAVLVASVILIPSNSSAASRGEGAAESGTSTSDGVLPTDGVTPSDTSPDLPETDTPPPQSGDEQKVVLMGDDPIAALQALLTARARCFDTRSVSCLDSVEQIGSAVWEMDRATIARQEAGGESTPILLTATEITVSDRLGDSAILVTSDADTSMAMTVLILRDEDGWRIRDIIAP